MHENKLEKNFFYKAIYKALPFRKYNSLSNMQLYMRLN